MHEEGLQGGWQEGLQGGWQEGSLGAKLRQYRGVHPPSLALSRVQELLPKEIQDEMRRVSVEWVRGGGRGARRGNMS